MGTGIVSVARGFRFGGPWHKKLLPEPFETLQAAGQEVSSPSLNKLWVVCFGDRGIGLKIGGTFCWTKVNGMAAPHVLVYISLVLNYLGRTTIKIHYF